MNELVTFILTMIILSAMLGVYVGFCIHAIVNKPKRKRKRPLEDWEYEVLVYKRELAAWQVNKALMKPKPLDTSWGNMNAKELERLEYVREYLQSGCDNMSKEEQARLDAVIDFERWQMRGGLPK